MSYQSLRSPENEARYNVAKAQRRLIPLGDVAPMKCWRFWKLIPNAYGYDRFFGEGVPFEHCMIIPIRVFARRSEMKLMELAERELIYDELEKDGWDTQMQNFESMRSIPDHYHEHVLRRKK